MKSRGIAPAQVRSRVKEMFCLASNEVLFPAPKQLSGPWWQPDPPTFWCSPCSDSDVLVEDLPGYRSQAGRPRELAAAL